METSFYTELTKWLEKSSDGDVHVVNLNPFFSYHLKKSDLHILAIGIEDWKSGGYSQRFSMDFLEKHHHQRWVILWEDIWMKHQEIVKSRLRSFVGQSKRVHGRKLKVIQPEPAVCRSFLNSNHLMGFTAARYNYALTDGEEILALASFGRSVPVQRNDKEVISHELIRFCHKLDMHVSGGLSKLIKHFIRKEQPEDIFTSVDREWSDGSGYAKLGFQVLGITEPMCFSLDQQNERKPSGKNGGIQICNAGNIRMALTLK